MKKFLVLLVIIIASGFLGMHHVLASSSNPTITPTPTSTSTTTTVNYHYVGTPTQTTQVYSWLGVANSTNWVDRSNLLITIPQSNTQVTKDFSVTYDYSALGLTANGTQYVYYLADGTTDTSNILSGPGYFTVGTAAPVTYSFAATGQVAGTAAGMYQEKFTVTPSAASSSATTLTLAVYNTTNTTTAVSQNSVPISAGSAATVSPGSDDLPPGTYTANLLNGTTNVGSVNFTITAPAAQITMQLASILAPADTVTMTGTVTAGSAVSGGHLVLKVGTSPTLLNIAETAFDGTIPTAGTPFTVSIDSLTGTGPAQYYYGFTETTTNTDLSSGTFTINTSTNQAPGATQVGDNDGTCNPAYDNTVVNTAPAADTPNLCSNGTVTDFSGGTNGPWQWTCAAVAAGGTSDICTVSLAAGGTGGGPACATGPFTTATPASSLCASGSASGLDSSTSNWTWQCITSPYAPVPCSATVTQGGSPGGSTTTPTTPTTSGSTAGNLLQNPISYSSFPQILTAIYTNIILPISYVFLPLMFIYAGFLFVIARKKGSADGVEKAKTTLKWTVIGAVLIIGAGIAATALQGSVSQIFGTGSSTTTTTTH